MGPLQLRRAAAIWRMVPAAPGVVAGVPLEFGDRAIIREGMTAAVTLDAVKRFLEQHKTSDVATS